MAKSCLFFALRDRLRFSQVFVCRCSRMFFSRTRLGQPSPTNGQNSKAFVLGLLGAVGGSDTCRTQVALAGFVNFSACVCGGSLRVYVWCRAWIGSSPAVELPCAAFPAQKVSKLLPKSRHFCRIKKFPNSLSNFLSIFLLP